MNNFPKYVDLEFSARCNLACGFCFGPADDRRSPDFPPAFWRGVIDGIALRGAHGIVVSGGEPTLYAGLHELLSHARRSGLTTVLSTHGRHRARLETVVGACNWIALPVDARSSKMLLELRGDDWGLEQAVDTAIALKRLSPSLRIKLGTVATRLNRHEITRLADELLACPVGVFDTWKIYQYTPRRKFASSRSVYEISDEQFAEIETSVRSTAVVQRLNTVFSSRASRRRAYLFVYPDATIAIPNESETFGDVILGNLAKEGVDALDKAGEFVLGSNAANFEATYA